MEEENFDYLEWNKIDFQQLETKMSDSAKNSLDAVKYLEEMVNGKGDCKAAFETTDTYMKYDFGPQGWFFNFVAVNENALAQFHPTTQEDIQKYAYWEDLKLFKSMCEKAYSGYAKLSEVLFNACFVFLQSKANMEAFYLNKSLYDQIDRHIKSVNSIVNSDRSSVPLQGFEEFIQKNKDKVEKLNKKKDEGFINILKKKFGEDYNKYIFRSDIGRELTMNSAGKYRVTQNMEGSLKAVDINTAAIAQASKHNCDKIKEACQEFSMANRYIYPERLEQLKTPLCKQLAESLYKLVCALQNYTAIGYDYLVKFKEHSLEPFIFMKNVPGIGEAHGPFLSGINKTEPWDKGGTNYLAVYNELYYALYAYGDKVFKEIKPYV